MVEIIKELLIIADTIRTAKHYAHMHSITKWKFIVSAEDLRGISKGMPFVRCGQWRKHPDIGKINQMLIIKEGKYCD